MNNNITSKETVAGHEIVIKSGNIGIIAGLLVIWLFGWTYAGYMLLKMFIDIGSNPVDTVKIVLLLVLAIIWFVGEIIMIGILVWGIFGREIITINQGIVKIKNDIVVRGKPRIFYVNNINDMQINVTIGAKLFEVKADFRTDKRKFVGIGLINFFYEGKVNRFCMSADKKDAEFVLTEMKKVLPEKAFRVNK